MRLFIISSLLDKLWHSRRGDRLNRKIERLVRKALRIQDALVPLLEERHELAQRLNDSVFFEPQTLAECKALTKCENRFKYVVDAKVKALNMKLFDLYMKIGEISDQVTAVYSRSPTHARK